MPIASIARRGEVFPQIGNIRKGGKKLTDRPGEDLHYFRFDFDESEAAAAKKVEEIYKAQPNNLRFVLPFAQVEKCWDYWKEAYLAGAMIHRCDGEWIQYEIDAHTGEKKVLNGYSLETGARVQCLGEPITMYESKGKTVPVYCEPEGRLSIMMPELGRAAYLVVHTKSWHDCENITRQLSGIALAQEMGGQTIAGVPLILRRKPYEISTPSGSNGQRARRKKWLISIEPDPDWVDRKIRALRSAAMPIIEQITAPQLPIGMVSTGPDLAELEKYDTDETNGHSEPETEEVLPTTGQEYFDWLKAHGLKPKDSNAVLGMPAEAWIKQNEGGYAEAAKVVAATFPIYGEA